MVKTRGGYTLIFMLSISFQLFAQSEDVVAIRQLFEKYKSAVLNDQEAAVEFVDKRTIDYYTDILEKVKMADSVTVNGLSAVNKFSVLLIRQKIPKQEILSFDSKALLGATYKYGMNGKNNLVNTSLGEITINGNFASAEALRNEKRLSDFFHFYREEEHWKLNLTIFMPSGEQLIRQLIDQSGKSENEYLFSLIEMVSGKKATSQIWLPVQK